MGHDRSRVFGGRRIEHGSSLGDENQPLVTIITAVRNGADCLSQCIESVLAQDYPCIEHIVLDGASTDGTVALLERYGRHLAVWSSEPDDGVYDAWNKGLALARGEWIAFLGADDEFTPEAVSAYMALAKKHPAADYLSSKVRWVHSSGYNRVLGEPWSWPRYSRFMCSIHVGSMHRRRLFTKYGQFDTSYRITADYEFLLRPRGALRCAFLPAITVRMSAGGLSDSVAALREASRARIGAGTCSRLTAFPALAWAIVKYGIKGVLHAYTRVAKGRSRRSAA